MSLILSLTITFLMLMIDFDTYTPGHGKWSAVNIHSTPRLLLHVGFRPRVVVSFAFVVFVVYRLFPGDSVITDFDHIDNSPAVNYQTPATLEVELEERRRLVANVCAKYNLTSRGQPNARQFFVENKHKLVWCNIFKAASSTWMYYFNLLGGYDDEFLRHNKTDPLKLARARFRPPRISQLQSALPRSLSFFVVREPFVRILSAFRDKLENPRNSFYAKMAAKMIPKNRTVAEGQRNSSLTFPEFVDHVVKRATDKKPYFNEHWAPFYKFCTPCRVNFTVIVKLETFERDEEYIIRVAKLGDVLIPDLRRNRPENAVNRARDGKDTKSLVERYYSQLSLDQLTRLYDIYKIDFEMFGYSEAKYFDIAGKPASSGIFHWLHWDVLD